MICISLNDYKSFSNKLNKTILSENDTIKWKPLGCIATANGVSSHSFITSNINSLKFHILIDLSSDIVTTNDFLVHTSKPVIGPLWNGAINGSNFISSSFATSLSALNYILNIYPDSTPNIKLSS